MKKLGSDWVRIFVLGHEVTHVRLCDGLPEMEEIEGVRHIRIKGADAVDNSIALKCLELPYV